MSIPLDGEYATQWCTDDAARSLLNTDDAGLQAYVDSGALHPLMWQGTDPPIRCFDRAAVVSLARADA